MKLLMDTDVFLWALMETSRLSPLAIQVMTDPSNQVFLSAFSFWEISLKHSLGTLELEGFSVADLPRIASQKAGFHLLELDAQTAAGSGNIPRLHTDPFDRILIQQAVAGGFTMLSANREFPSYQTRGLNLLW